MLAVNRVEVEVKWEMMSMRLRRSAVDFHVSGRENAHSED